MLQIFLVQKVSLLREILKVVERLPPFHLLRFGLHLLERVLDLAGREFEQVDSPDAIHDELAHFRAVARLDVAQMSIDVAGSEEEQH